MAKRSILATWGVGLAALGLAAALIVASIVALIAHFDQLASSGSGGVVDEYARLMYVLAGAGLLIAAVGIVALGAGWLFALANTRKLADRRWFNAVLWGGIVGLLTTPLLGVGAAVLGTTMTAYAVGAPDVSRLDERERRAAFEAETWSKDAIWRRSRFGIVPIAVGGLLALAVGYLGNPNWPLHGQTWLALALLIVSLGIVVAGVVVETACWWAAILNTRRLPDRSWFRVLTVGGLITLATMPLLGLGALIALVVGLIYERYAPDATVSAAASRA